MKYARARATLGRHATRRGPLKVIESLPCVPRLPSRVGARGLRSLLPRVEVRGYPQFTLMFLLEFEGIDSLLWEQAKKDNPDPQRYNPSFRKSDYNNASDYRDQMESSIGYFKVSLT